jgi:hypothetical protein
MAEPAIGARKVARQSCGRSSDRPTTAPHAAVYGRSKHIGFLTEFNRAVLLSHLKSKSKLYFEVVRDLSTAPALGFNPDCGGRAVLRFRVTPRIFHVLPAVSDGSRAAQLVCARRAL